MRRHVIPPADDARIAWTAKGPALIAGLVAIVLAMVATARGRLILAGVLLFLGAAFLTYSLTLKQWCVAHHGGWGGAWGENAFGDTLGDCIKEKGWFQL